MKIFEATITSETSKFLCKNLVYNNLYQSNKIIKEHSGIIDFFEDIDELNTIFENIKQSYSIVSEPDRTEYGDFQTPENLCSLTCKLLENKGIKPKVIIEPTCGKGNFILAALEHFETIETIIGIEIYQKYVWESKFSILNYFIIHQSKTKPEIKIYNKNIFDFNFKEILKQINDKEFLILGNPSWVTNSKLSTLNSSNLPQKANFKNHNGLDAITGKGNFDIAEYICLIILTHFTNYNGHFAFLQKNSVIKNIVFEQLKTHYSISNLEKYSFDAKKEFNVATDASLFYCQFNQKYTTICNEYSLYEPQHCKNQFGWFKDKFVANLTTFSKLYNYDGACPIIWRQGIKHDCSKVMELEKFNNLYVNYKNEVIEIEEDLVYGILKSSDIKTGIINQTRKYTIVTQTKIGQSTNYIVKQFPKTHNYLSANLEYFVNRKSSIYQNKPNFSIFGVGDYSFKKYKVAISGFYKATQFALLLPINNKAIQLDDTCYFIGFNKLEYAVFSYIVLNHLLTQNFLNAIIFYDSKRPITKEILMRIDLYKISRSIEYQEVINYYNKNLSVLDCDINKQTWKEYCGYLESNMELNAANLFSPV